MSTPERLQQYVEGLKSMARSLLTEADSADSKVEEAFTRLCGSESRDELNFGPQVLPLDRAKQLEDLLKGWRRVFEDALEITLGVPPQADFAEEDRPTKLVLRGSGVNIDNVAAMVERCEAHEADLEFSILIDKGTLLNTICSELSGLEGYKFVLFFCAQRLAKILAEYRCEGLEESFLKFDEDAGRYLILVADRPGAAVGPYLSMLGSTDSLLLDKILRRPTPPVEAERILEAMRKHCNWDGRPTRLTPTCLWLGAAGNADLGECRNQVTRLQNELSLGFLANRSTRTEAGLSCTFEGERTVKVLVRGGPHERTAYKLYQWAYEDLKTVAVRLEIVRRVISSYFVLASSNDPFQVLRESDPRLLKECRIQLRVLIDRNLVESFNRRQEVKQLVRTYIDEVSTQIRALAKEAVDNTYRTVGLLVGVAIAYLLKPSEGPLILAVGVGLYLIYVLFVRLFYIGSIEADYSSRKSHFQREKEHITQSQLIQADDLFEPVVDSESRFDTRWRVVRLVYGVLLAAGVVLLVIALSSLRETSPEQIKARALKLQQNRFAAMGYSAIRVNLAEGTAPAPITDTVTGQTATPDLSAISPESYFVILHHLPCAQIGEEDELVRLKLFQRLAQEKGYRLHLLTPASCGNEPGPDAVRHWLESGEQPVLVIWSYD